MTEPSVEQAWQMPDDIRLGATLEYTTSDDGIWLVYGVQRVCLDCWPSVEDVWRAAQELTP